MTSHVSISGNIAGPGSSQINNVNNSYGYNIDDVDRACLQALRCPDSFLVKTRLKANKDKLLRQSFDWVLHDPQYIDWQQNDEVGLLWIKGGAGKGKTMMSIGLIEELTRQPKHETVVTYFFCQSTDIELNTINAVIKGLIRQLLRQQASAKQCLRDRWDMANKAFTEDTSSWQGLWNLLIEMLDSCACPRTYVIVDAVDECRDHHIFDLLRLLVRTGLSRPSQIKWLLTSRPLDSAQQVLLGASDQTLISLDLNAEHISLGVKTYVSHKVAELERYWRPDPVPYLAIEEALARKAEETFLWVSLACKELEQIPPEEALEKIETFQPGLDDMYGRADSELRSGRLKVVHGCVRLLKCMVLAYRPLNVHEISVVTGTYDEQSYFSFLIDRCACFVRKREGLVEFIHQSARDYFDTPRGKSLLHLADGVEHADIASNCLDHLSQHLKVNLLGFAQWDAKWDSSRLCEDDILNSLDYAASFWHHHLALAKDDTGFRQILSSTGPVEKLFRNHILEWFECLSLLGRLLEATEALGITSGLLLLDGLENPSPNLAALLEDAKDFLEWNHHIISTWPLQIYSSALTFSPETTIVKKANVHRISHWLRKATVLEQDWTSLMQAGQGHLGSVKTVAISPDDRTIASGSDDKTIKLWDVRTGAFIKTLVEHTNAIASVLFSPDGQSLIATSWSGTVKIWHARTGLIQKTLGLRADILNISPDGQLIATTDYRSDTLIVWDMDHEYPKQELTGCTNRVSAVAFSPDGCWIASGSDDPTLRLWNMKTGNLEKTLLKHTAGVKSLLFSPDGRRIISRSWDGTTKIWTTSTGQVEWEAFVDGGFGLALAVSPDSLWIALSSGEGAIQLWSMRTKQLVKVLTGHCRRVRSLAFTLDGQRIVSGSDDMTIKIWDTETGDVEHHLSERTDPIITVALSWDGQLVVSGSTNGIIEVWNARTGDVERTLEKKPTQVRAVAFSPNSQYIASVRQHSRIYVWDWKEGKIEWRLYDLSTASRTLAFSADGRWIASGCDNKTITMWDLRTGHIAWTLMNHKDRVTELAFSPDGQWLASGAADGNIKIWGSPQSLKGQELSKNSRGMMCLFRARQGLSTSNPVNHLRFSADSTCVIMDEECWNILDGRRGQALSPYALSLSGQWIICGSKPIIKLPLDLQASCYDVNEERVAIGFSNGRVLVFEIDGERVLRTDGEGSTAALQVVCDGTKLASDGHPTRQALRWCQRTGTLWNVLPLLFKSSSMG